MTDEPLDLTPIEALLARGVITPYAGRALLAEVKRLRAQLAAVEALATDAAAQNRTEIMPVRGMAALIRAALAGHTQADYVLAQPKETP